jgi:hypothetical protein
MTKVVALCVLLLQGAGCGARHTGRIQGTVTVPEGTEFPPDVRIIYRRHDKVVVCTDDWSPCLKASAWVPLRRCSGRLEDSIVTKTEDRRNEFEACTAKVDVAYAADLIAFVDRDHDGMLGSGERYGVWKGNPLTRDREKGPVAFEFELDRTLP